MLPYLSKSIEKDEWKKESPRNDSFGEDPEVKVTVVMLRTIGKPETLQSRFDSGKNVSSNSLGKLSRPPTRDELDRIDNLPLGEG